MNARGTDPPRTTPLRASAGARSRAVIESGMEEPPRGLTAAGDRARGRRFRA